MTDTIAAPSGPAVPPSPGLAERIAGVIVSPGDTYRAVAARPRAFGVLAVVTVVMAATAFVFLSTEVGQNASLDQQMRVIESLGIALPEEAYQQMEDRAGMARYFAVGGILTTIPLISAAAAGLILLIFNVALGGDASFRQAFAIVVHAEILIALQQLFVMPLNYARETMSSATTLAVFLPMLDETTFLVRLLGWIDLFRIWWIVSLAIGIGVLYRRKAAPIGWTLLGVYAVFALAAAAIVTAIGGA